MAYTIVKNYLSSSKYSLKAPYSMSPNGVTVHNTANDAAAINEVKYMIGNNASTSYHVAVDDVNVVLAIPFNRNAWHAGDGNGNGNRKTIGIEICYSKSGGTKFDNAEKNAAKYIATLLKDYGWTIKNVYRHKDWSGKNCPHRTMANGWERFLNMVQDELNKLNGTTSSTTTSTPNSSTSVPFSIKVDKVAKGDVLNIRKEPNANAAKTGQLAYNDPNTYTIIEVKNGWGLLKSKLGWINLNYTKKVSKEAATTTTTVNKPVAPIPKPTPTKVNVTYAVQIEGGKVLPAVTNLADYAGIENKKITGIAMKVDKGSIKYQVHVLGGGWLPWVTGYNWKDHNNGYAGNGRVIDGIRVYYTTPSDVAKNSGYKCAKYRVSTTGSGAYYSWQIDDSKKNGMDGYAGCIGKAIDKLQVHIE